MINESYVRFDTARLLKEAGFDASVNTTYRMDEGGDWHFNDEITKQIEYNLYDNVIEAPTQDIAARWLRETYGIHVYANYFFEDCDWFYVTVNLKESDEVKGVHPNESSFDTYEAALEAGLQQALKQIVKTDLQSD